MTEADWVTCNDPEAMLAYCQHEVWNSRRTRLLAVACCRLVWNVLTPWHRNAVEVSERYADERASREEFLRVAWFTMCGCPSDADWIVAQARAGGAWVHGQMMATSFANLYSPTAAEVGLDVVVSVIREVFGNPFRPGAFRPEWRTNTTMGLVAQMYESRDFNAMPILAAAIQDAGCDNDEILKHCRGSGPHVRGCWVVDLILGKG